MSVHTSLSMQARENVIAREQTSYRNPNAELLEARDAILAEIMPYFTFEMWAKWVDAGPDDLTEFIQYATDELQNVLTEMFEDEREQQAAECAEIAEWLPLIDAIKHPETVEGWDETDLPTGEQASLVYGDGPEFGSAAWFAGIPEGEL